MDKIIKIVMGLFIVILVLFIAVFSYSSYIDTAYRNSLNGTYLYTCTISTDGVLSNVTLFLSVPAAPNGNSPVVAEISSRDVSGVPAEWNLTLFGTGKATLLKVSARTIGQPAINGTAQPTTITFMVNVSSPSLIETALPVENAAVFRPVQSIHPVACPAGDTTSAGTSFLFPVPDQYLCRLFRCTCNNSDHQRECHWDKYMDNLLPGIERVPEHNQYADAAWREPRMGNHPWLD